MVKFFLIMVLCTLIASADQTNDSDKYTFDNYGGEVYTPEPMEFGANLDGTGQISVMTASDTLENQTERKHVLLQFYEIPNDEQLGVLKEYGVRRVAVAAKYTYIFSMPADYTAADLPDDVGLRWMGKILVENKYEGLNVPDYARTEDGQVELEIHFYEDVTSEEAQVVAQKYSTITPQFYHQIHIIYDVTINESNITSIASEDIVQFVCFPASEDSPTDAKQSSGFQVIYGVFFLTIAFFCLKRRGSNNE
ncbi:hypothetical protein [uncultured Methanolobus sp.]|uniref:hypothetical protein n=1 Tax=uncultured Methanolobus sp. TaxID=218300 RepID=UPI002AAB898C|nr:hypothetical protein [uncultured Methanolobus sp.]